MKKERHKVVVIVCAVVIKDKKILLLLRKNTGFADNYYNLVAGKVESGETIDEAMVRELREEANITVKPEDLELATVTCRPGDVGCDDYLDFCFIVKDFSGEIHNNEPEKCGDLRFFELDNMPSNMMNCVTKTINNALNGKKYENLSEYD